jgi:hypothetical protein
VPAVFDIPEESEAEVGGGGRESACNRLDLEVVWGDSRADETEGCGQAFEHVDREFETGSVEEMVRGKEGGWSGSDDRNAESRRRWICHPLSLLQFV